MTSETDGQLFDLSPLAMAFIDPVTAAITAVNPCGLKLLDQDPAMLLGRSPMSLGWTSEAQWQALLEILHVSSSLFPQVIYEPG
jgi:hypothetical protein